MSTPLLSACIGFLLLAYGLSQPRPKPAWFLVSYVFERQDGRTGWGNMTSRWVKQPTDALAIESMVKELHPDFKQAVVIAVSNMEVTP